VNQNHVSPIILENVFLRLLLICHLNQILLIIFLPFAYFTQIIHFAFLRRISKEKRQLEIKNKILERTGFDEVFTDDSNIDGMNYSDYNSIKDLVHSKLRG